MHCDAVQYNSSTRAGQTRSIIAGSMNVISGRSRRDRARRMPLFVLRKSRLCQCGCQGYHTIQEINEVLAWSFTCLAQGKAPRRRHDGSNFTLQEIAHRHVGGEDIPAAAMLQYRGDWEWLELAFRFRSVNADEFCWLCNCTKRGPLSFMRMRPDALHKATLISHQVYLQLCARLGVQPSHLFRVPGFLLDLHYREHRRIQTTNHGEIRSGTRRSNQNRKCPGHTQYMVVAVTVVGR